MNPEGRPTPSRLARWLSQHTIGASVAVGALLSIGIGAGLAEAASDPSDVLPLSEVKPGMKGYGKTVFKGTTPEQFDVEIISVLRNFRPNQDLILIKTPNHPRLDAARVVAGMSGSPIYLNNKMIGAYAYGWIAGVEPIAGVTPIRSMLDELARPIPTPIAPLASGGPLPSTGSTGSVAPTISPARRFTGSIDTYDLNKHAEQIAGKVGPALSPPDGYSLSRASTPLLLGGMTTSALKIAKDLFGPAGFEPLQAGGGSSAKPDADAPTAFVDGGAIGVELVRGDVSAMGLGTVTRVSGDKLLAFGHPMMNGGIENFPTAIAKVHWILASYNRSFKIGEASRSMGALVNDRQAAIVVDTKAKAPTFPMLLKIEGVDGAPKTTWSMEVSHDKFLAPAFAVMGLSNAVETTTSERNDTTWRSRATLSLKKYGTVTVEDFGASDGAFGGPENFVRGRISRALGMLFNNPWEDVTIDKIDCTVKVTFEQEVALLRGVKLLDTEIEAGESARIQLELEAWKGKVEKKTISVKLGAEFAGRDVDITIAPGYEVDRPQATPTTLAELVANLQSPTQPTESIVATIRYQKEASAAVSGLVAERLPASAIDTLSSATDSDGPEIFAAQSHVVFPMKGVFIGRDSVRVKVKPVVK